MPIRCYAAGADVDRWTDALCALRGSANPPVRGLFCADTVAVWDPDESDFRHDELRFLRRWWHDRVAAQGGAPPLVQPLDPLALRPALGHLATLEPVDGGADFRFRLYGSLIATRSGFEMTGKLASTMPTSPEAVAFLTASYRAAMRLRAPLYTEHTPWTGQSVTRWFRFLMPFAGADGTVQRIVVGNLPGANRLPSVETLDEIVLGKVA